MPFGLLDGAHTRRGIAAWDSQGDTSVVVPVPTAAQFHVQRRVVAKRHSTAHPRAEARDVMPSAAATAIRVVAE